MTADVIALAPFLAAREAAKAPPAQVEAAEAERKAIADASRILNKTSRAAKLFEDVGDRASALRLYDLADADLRLLHTAYPCDGVLVIWRQATASRGLVAARQLEAFRRELRA